jgi:hypothetical protein
VTVGLALAPAQICATLSEGYPSSVSVPLAIGTGEVVIVVAIAVVLLVLIVTLSLRQRRNATARVDLIEAHERAARAERDLEIAQEQARQRTDPDK